MVYYGDEVLVLSVRIHAVSAGSPAEKAGIQPDDRIVSINDTPIADEIDYQALSTGTCLRVRIEHEGVPCDYTIRKSECLMINISI